jgi:hypothetical protein
VAPSTSARKVARLASKGKGKKIRFQGGTVFPAVVLIVVVALTALVVYARQSRPASGSGHPVVGDHWHAAYGMRVCDVTLPKLAGTKEDSAAYANIGVHSHGDGVIHYHPSTSRSTGNRAKLGVFLDMYGVKLSTNTLELPADQGGEKFTIKDSKLEYAKDGKPVDLASSPYAACAGKDMQLKVRVWAHFNKGDYQDYVTDLTGIRIRNDGMVFEIALVEKGTDVKPPDWAANLPELGAADTTGGVPTETVPGGVTADTTAGSAPAASTPLTTVGGSTPGTAAVPETAASTSPPTTTG